MPEEVNVKALRRLNITQNRTDVENLFLKEMLQEDQEMIINETDDLAVDTIIPDEVGNTGLFGDSSSDDIDDILDDDDDFLDGFSMVEL